jgi:hypothetical protein
MYRAKRLQDRFYVLLIPAFHQDRSDRFLWSRLSSIAVGNRIVFGNLGHFVLQSVTEGNVRDVMEECGQSKNVKKMATVAASVEDRGLILQIFQIVRDLSCYVHYPEHVLKPSVLRRRVDKISQTELSAAVESLKPRGVNNTHLMLGKFNIAMNAVPEYLH